MVFWFVVGVQAPHRAVRAHFRDLRVAVTTLVLGLLLPSPAHGANIAVMLARRLATTVLLSLFILGCSEGDGSVPCGDLRPRSADEVALCNELDQAVIAHVALPEGEPPKSGWPGVMLLHGSGGLFVADPEAYPCSETLHDEFRVWSELLTDRGYAVIMPASFYSRGFCDWTEDATVPPKFSDHERLVARTFDAAAAADWLCDDPRVDCSKLAAFGFSNGASTALLLLHEDLREADDARLHRLTAIPSFSGGVTYYPGCGLEDEVSEYFPQAPLFVPHAGKDPLLETCAELRDVQVDATAKGRGMVEDMFELDVYPQAEHGFDVWFTGDPQADYDARMDAQAKVLSKLQAWLG